MKEFLKNILNRQILRDPEIPLYFSFFWGLAVISDLLVVEYDKTSKLYFFGLIFPLFFFSLWGIIISINNSENKKEPNE